jgi:hypothetical protein
MSFSAQTSEKFARHIEARVLQANIGYMEAVLEFCEQRQLEPEAILPLMNDKIKTAIGAEAQRLNLIPKSNQLPL